MISTDTVCGTNNGDSLQRALIDGPQAGIFQLQGNHLDFRPGFAVLVDFEHLRTDPFAQSAADAAISIYFDAHCPAFHSLEPDLVPGHPQRYPGQGVFAPHGPIIVRAACHILDGDQFIGGRRRKVFASCFAMTMSKRLTQIKVARKLER
jgi:hypothetical protein